MAEPGLIAPIGSVASGAMPSAVVVCFFAAVIERPLHRDDAELVGVVTAAHARHRVLSVPHGSGRAFQSRVGAPIAAAFPEEVVAAGGRSVLERNAANCEDESALRE